MAQELKERFDAKWTPEPFSGCWLWTACIDEKGYGKIFHHRRAINAHRISWQLFNGDIPGDLCVLHKCDTPGCVNPNHLFLGTRLDNVKDRDAKQRQMRGEAHVRAILSSEEVKEIRTSKERTSDLSRKMGINYNTIRYARNHLSWKHIT